VPECHCGTSRAAVEAQARRDRERDAPARASLLLLGAVAVVVVTGYLALFRYGAAPAPAPPAPEGSAVGPETAPAAVSWPVSDTADRRDAGAAAAPPAEPTDGWDAPTPVPEPVPTGTPGPAPTAQAERSEVDTRRDAGQERLEQRLARLQAELTRLSANTREYESACLGMRGDPRSCQRLFDEIASGGEGLERGLQEAEEDARRSWVLPGVVRDLRRKHGLEESACSDVVSAVRRLAAQRRGAS
jgi:hypothetical protein